MQTGQVRDFRDTGERLQRQRLHFQVYEHLATSAQQNEGQKRESPSTERRGRMFAFGMGGPFWGMAGQEMGQHSRESSVRNNQMQHQWMNPPSASINTAEWHKERWVGERTQTYPRSLFGFRPWLLSETICHDMLVKWVWGCLCTLKWPQIALCSIFPI